MAKGGLIWLKKITSGTNILPNNPMAEHGLLAHLKEVKGSAGWYVFNLRCLVAAYPGDKIFKDALAAEDAKLATPPATPPAVQGMTDKETEATDATTVNVPAPGTSSEQAEPDKVTPAPSAATGKATKKTKADKKAGAGNGK